MTDEIKAMLDTLAEFQAEIDAANLAKQEMIDAVLTPEIRAKIADIEAEFSGKTETAREKINSLTDQIKTAVVAGGASVKGANLHAVYAKGRVSWDAKSLDGYAVGHPEILSFRKEGEPSVSIRKV